MLFASFPSRVVVLTAVLAALFSSETFAVQPRIVGGVDAEPGAWPWMASIHYVGDSNYNGHFCGGTLIHPQWIVTAAHCAEGEKAADLEVLVGAYDLKTTDEAIVMGVKAIYIHPDWNHRTYDSDIALLKLKKPVLLRAAYFTESLPEVKDIATVIGWGLRKEDGRFYPHRLQQVDVPVVSWDACHRVYGNELTETMLCAGYNAGGKDSCQGDSGGPLVIKQNGAHYLAGIVSWGSGCAEPKYFGVYTDVNQHRIRNFLQEAVFYNKNEHFQAADENKDGVVNVSDKTAKWANLNEQLTTWMTECETRDDSYCDLNLDNVYNDRDMKIKQGLINKNYIFWLKLHWQRFSS
jgi:trypsin